MAPRRSFFGTGPVGQAIAWSFFDFGNSAYALILLSFAFPVWFKETLAPAAHGEFAWGLLVSGSALLGALAAPWIGAWTSAHGLRRAGLAVFTAISVVGSIALGLLPAPGLLSVIMLFASANIAFELALVLYDSFLPQVSTPATAGRISGLGWGLGYLGGILALVLLRPLYADGVSGDHATRYRLAFAAAALLFLAAALPALLLLRDTPVPTASAPPSAWRRVKETLAAFRRDRRLPLLLLAGFLLNDALVTLFVFVPAYALGTLGMAMGDIAVLLLAVQLLGFPSTLLFGWFGDRFGPKPVLLCSLGIWVAVVALAAMARTPAAFYPAAALTGLVIGSSQSLYRTWFASLAPPDREAEWFGFNALAGKVSAAFGPLAFGAAASWLGPRIAMAALALPFLWAGICFAAVREKDSPVGSA